MKCGGDNRAHDFLTCLKFLQRTDSDRFGAAGSTGGGLKILLLEYTEQTTDKEVAETLEEQAGTSSQVVEEEWEEAAEGCR